MTNTQITNKQFITFELQKKTDIGQDVDPTPAPVWSLESGPTDPATVTVAQDGFSGQFTSGTTAGDSTFLVQSSVGGVPVSEEVMVTVTVDPRTGKLVITFGTPTDKPAVPPPTA